MNQGEPPKRKTPLQRGQPLRRSSGLVRRPLPAAAACMSKGRRVRRTSPVERVCRIVDARAGAVVDGAPAWCEWPGCDRVGTDRHHRLNRKDGGRHGAMAELVNGVAWLLKACRRHHRRVTSAHGAVLAEAKAMGWVLVEGQHAERVPVLTRHWPEPVWLLPDGGWTARPPSTRAA